MSKILAYYGYTISPNQLETGEGFLICRNVPIARIGDMEYTADELGLPGGNMVTVHRAPEEVFSPAAMASFEGKPVTNDHPPGLLNPDSVSMYEEGHAQTIRQGVGEWEGYLVADLHIHSRSLIQAVQGGKREVSCGYECEYVSNGDGTYSQKNIRGNHIAVVNRGRAGRKAAILDSSLNKHKAQRPERKNMKKTGVLLKLFGMSVKDKSPEEEKKEETKKDPMDAAIEALEGKGETEDKKKEASVIPAGDGKPEQPEGAMDKAMAAEILRRVRPSVAAIKNEKERKAVADALIASVTGGWESDVEKIIHAAQKNANRAADSGHQTDLDAVQKAYDNLNPHRKENK